MQAGAPDPEPGPTEPDHSLVGRLAAAVRRRRAPPGPAGGRATGEGGRRIGRVLALAGLIAAGPLAVGAGARLLHMAVNRDIEATQAALAPKLAEAHDRAVVRDALQATLVGPGPAETLDRIAAVLPADASLLRAERLADGALELDIASADPDALRTALHRAPWLARLHDIGQRQGDGVMIVSLRQAAK
ncbi:hypothetical protein ACX40Y_15370 [Sphingomonas sp. RS6]